MIDFGTYTIQKDKKTDKFRINESLEKSFSTIEEVIKYIEYKLMSIKY